MSFLPPPYALCMLLAVALAACGGAAAPTAATTTSPEPTRAPGTLSTDASVPHPAPLAVGGQKDAHGCYLGAGYSWCEKEQQCSRPWELARAKGFTLSKSEFDRYCGN